MKDSISIQEKTQKVELGTIAYLDYNASADKVIVCVHAINRNKHDFHFLALDLARAGFRVISLDMIGRGGSSYIDEEKYEYPTYTKVFIDFVNKMSLQQFGMIGSSMGGLISILAAGELGTRMSPIVINDIGPFTDRPALQILAKYLALYPKFESYAEGEKFMRMMLKPLNITKEEHWQHMISHSLKKVSDGEYRLDYDPAIFVGIEKRYGSEARSLWENWEKVPESTPILILRGGKSKILSPETLEKMVLSKKKISALEYPEAGHTPSLLDESQIHSVREWFLEQY